MLFVLIFVVIVLSRKHKPNNTCSRSDFPLCLSTLAREKHESLILLSFFYFISYYFYHLMKS